MTQYTVSNILQSKLQFDGAEFTEEELADAAERSTLAQSAIDERKLKALTKDIVSQGVLFEAPVMCYVTSTGEWHLTSGRHRLASTIAIAQQYGVNEAGELVSIDHIDTYGDPVDKQGNALAQLDVTIKCRTIEVPTPVEAAFLVMHANGSRTMTPAEQMRTKIVAGTLTNAMKRKHAVSDMLCDLVDSIREQTALNLATSLLALKQVKAALKNADEAQLTEFVTEFAAFVNANRASFDSNFALTGFKQALAAFTSQLSREVAYDEKGEAVAGYTRVDEITATWLPAVKVKAPGKKMQNDALQATVAALTKALEAQGIDPAAILATLKAQA